jgi:hypothetical protein
MNRGASATESSILKSKYYVVVKEIIMKHFLREQPCINPRKKFEKVLLLFPCPNNSTDQKKGDAGGARGILPTSLYGQSAPVYVKKA